MSENSSELIRAVDEAVSAQPKYQVSIPDWSGPFDILLQVIDERDLNLLDLDISELLSGYLEHLSNSPHIDVEEAGEFLVVGATLAQIKSKLLLPKDETEVPEEEIDPRAELVRYLMEYQKIKQAAALLGERPILGRDVFLKGAREHFQGVEGQGSGSLFQLVKGFQKVLREIKAQDGIRFDREEVPVSQRLQEVFQMVSERQEVEFTELLTAAASKVFIVVTFLSILELVRLKKIKLHQLEVDGPIYLRSVEGASSEDLLASEFDESQSISDEERVNATQSNQLVQEGA